MQETAQHDLTYSNIPSVFITHYSKWKLMHKCMLLWLLFFFFFDYLLPPWIFPFAFLPTSSLTYLRSIAIGKPFLFHVILLVAKMTSKNSNQEYAYNIHDSKTINYIFLQPFTPSYRWLSSHSNALFCFVLHMHTWTSFFGSSNSLCSFYFLFGWKVFHTRLTDNDTLKHVTKHSNLVLNDWRSNESEKKYHAKLNNNKRQEQWI